VALVVWSLWLQRNDRIFRNGLLSAVLLVDQCASLKEQWCRATLVARSSKLLGE
jgi:hypothetical protein